MNSLNLQDVLDEEVQDAHTQMATSVNNEGASNQLAFLIENGLFDHVVKKLAAIDPEVAKLLEEDE
jgi:hypothetical protein